MKTERMKEIEKHLGWTENEIFQALDIVHDSTYAETQQDSEMYSILYDGKIQNLCLEYTLGLNGNDEEDIKYYKVNLPNKFLEVFHKSNYINEILIDDLKIPRSLFLLNGVIISNDQRDKIIAKFPDTIKYMNEFSPEDEHLSKEKIISILIDNTDVIFKLKSQGNKDRYLIKLTTMINEFIQVGIIDLSFETIFCFIDEQNLIGCEQDLTELGTLLYNHYKISEIEIINLAYNANSTNECKIDFYKILEPVSKYVYKNKNFLTIPGNSGGGNLSTYLSEEEASRRSQDHLIKVNVQNSFRLKKD